MNQVSDIALFRFSVLGPLTSRIDLSRGDIQTIIKAQAEQEYDIPHSDRHKISPRTIEKWYYQWKKEGMSGLEPKVRQDKGSSKLTAVIRARIIQLKQDNMGRSVNTILKMLSNDNALVSRSAIYRVLHQEGISGRVISDAPSIERRKFEADYVNDIWYGDVMHGPSITVDNKLCKTYLVSLLDDASRLLTHSQFCLDETAESIEYILRQALLKRGIPKRLILDNGPAYISRSLKAICARLGIHLIYCRPYEPEAKGKIERWHRTVREQFLQELHADINSKYELNTRLWAWLDEYYHNSPHKGLQGQSPLKRYHQDLNQVVSVKMSMTEFDKIFYHRITRRISKDGTFTLSGKYYEVPYELAGKKVTVALTPSQRTPQSVEDKDGNDIGTIFALDTKSNLHRKRQRPQVIKPKKPKESLIEQALLKRKQRYGVDK